MNFITIAFRGRLSILQLFQFNLTYTHQNMYPTFNVTKNRNRTFPTRLPLYTGTHRFTNTHIGDRLIEPSRRFHTRTHRNLTIVNRRILRRRHANACFFIQNMFRHLSTTSRRPVRIMRSIRALCHPRVPTRFPHLRHQMSPTKGVRFPTRLYLTTTMSFIRPTGNPRRLTTHLRRIRIHSVRRPSMPPLHADNQYMPLPRPCDGFLRMITMRLRLVRNPYYLTRHRVRLHARPIRVRETGNFQYRRRHFMFRSFIPIRVHARDVGIHHPTTLRGTHTRPNVTLIRPTLFRTIHGLIIQPRFVNLFCHLSNYRLVGSPFQSTPTTRIATPYILPTTTDDHLYYGGAQRDRIPLCQISIFVLRGTLFFTETILFNLAHTTPTTRRHFPPPQSLPLPHHPSLHYNTTPRRPPSMPPHPRHTKSNESRHSHPQAPTFYDTNYP